jgi:hypothetical protein
MQQASDLVFGRALDDEFVIQGARMQVQVCEVLPSLTECASSMSPIVDA